MKIDFKSLTAEFKPKELEWRPSKSGFKRDGSPWVLIVPYIDARAIQERLDEVVGPENWQSHYTSTTKGVLCTLSIKINGEWIAKTDGSDDTDFEGFKGSISRALVRAAVHWGIGRYLYDMPKTFANMVSGDVKGARYIKIDNEDHFWLPPNEAEVSEQPQQSSVPKAVTAVSDSYNPGETEIPFGITQGMKLNQLNQTEISALQEFYDRVPNPQGKAKVFKKAFDLFLAGMKKSS